MSEAPDVLIVGGGIIGAACAAELAGRGLRVLVLERGMPGGGATAAGMGHVVAMDESPAQALLTRWSRALWAGAGDAERRADEYSACGTLWVAGDAADHAALRARAAAGPEAGELLDAAALRECEPALRPGLPGGLLVPDDAAVYAPRAAVRMLSVPGVRLMRGQAVALRPAAGPGPVSGVALADGGHLDAGAVVVATGCDVRDLAPEVPVRPRRGHLAITDRYPGAVRHQVVEVGYARSAAHGAGSSVAFNVQPRPTGQVLIGSSREPGASAAAVSPGVLGAMLARAVSWMPALGGFRCIRAWTGVRAASPDGLPLIGPHPARPGLWLATGHEGLGVTLAPATARLVAAGLLGRTPEIPPGPYLPSRFALSPPAPE